MVVDLASGVEYSRYRLAGSNTQMSGHISSGYMNFHHSSYLIIYIVTHQDYQDESIESIFVRRMSVSRFLVYSLEKGLGVPKR